MTENSTQTVVNTPDQGPGCLIRILYFIFVGLWLCGIVTISAWVLIVTLIRLPLPLWVVGCVNPGPELGSWPAAGFLDVRPGACHHHPGTLLNQNPSRWQSPGRIFDWYPEFRSSRAIAWL